jgi:hypothetical protein
MSLRIDLEQQLLTSPPHLAIEIGGTQWNVYVLGVSRIGGDTFVQMGLVGTRFCTVMARVPAAYDPDAKAREIVTLVLRWLGSDTRSTQAFLESPSCLSATA